MYKRWSSQLLASVYNSLFILATLAIICISLASGKWALLNSQIQKCVGICCHGESSTIVFYNSKESGGAKWFLPRSIRNDLARTGLDRREGGKFLSHSSVHLSDTKQGGWILKLQRLYDYAGVYPTEDSEAISAVHVHINSNFHDNSSCEGTGLRWDKTIRNICLVLNTAGTFCSQEQLLLRLF